MPFQFNPDEYKNKFAGRVIESVLRPSDNNPEQQVLYVVILRLKANVTRSGWEPIINGYACNIPGCVNIEPWHTHARYYESELFRSVAHRFLLSLREKGNFNMTSAEALVNKEFMWEEEIMPERPNLQTGGTYKEQRNYFVAGPLVLQAEQGSSSNGVAQASGELPWDQPAINTATPVAATPVTVATAAVVEAPAKLTYSDACAVLLPQIDGMTNAQVRALVMQKSDLRLAEGFLIAVMRGTVFDEFKRDGFITEDSDGVYHHQIS